MSDRIGSLVACILVGFVGVVGITGFVAACMIIAAFWRQVLGL